MVPTPNKRRTPYGIPSQQHRLLDDISDEVSDAAGPGVLRVEPEGLLRPSEARQGERPDAVTARRHGLQLPPPVLPEGTEAVHHEHSRALGASEGVLRGREGGRRGREGER